MTERTCWICGAPARAASSLCRSCHDRQTADSEPESVPIVAPEVTQQVPVAELTTPVRTKNAARWAWDKRRGLLGAVLAGAMAVLLVLGISFGWADASDRASELEHEVDASEQALHRAEKKLRKAQKEERKTTKTLDRQKAATEFLEGAYRGSQSQLQQAHGLLTSLQNQLDASNSQVETQAQCIYQVIGSLDGKGGNAAVKRVADAHC
jgi:septal ring factor EnvC (AmiA/AmiB activator)